MAEAHRLLFIKLLRTPLRALRDDVVVSSGALQMTASEYMERFQNQTACFVAARPGRRVRRNISIQCCTLFRFWFRLGQRLHRTPLPQLECDPHNLADRLPLPGDAASLAPAPAKADAAATQYGRPSDCTRNRCSHRAFPRNRWDAHIRNATSRCVTLLRALIHLQKSTRRQQRIHGEIFAADVAIGVLLAAEVRQMTPVAPGPTARPCGSGWSCGEDRMKDRGGWVFLPPSRPAGFR